MAIENIKKKLGIVNNTPDDYNEMIEKGKQYVEKQRQLEELRNSSQTKNAVNSITERVQNMFSNKNQKPSNVWERVQSTANNLANTQNVSNYTSTQNIGVPTANNINRYDKVINTTNSNNIKLSTKEEKKALEEGKKNGTVGKGEELTAQYEAQKKAEELNKQIAKGGSDKVNAIIENTLTNLKEGTMGAVGGIASIPETLGATALQKVNKLIKSEKIDNLEESMLDDVEGISNKYKENTRANQYINNKAVKTTGTISNTIGGMIPSIISNIFAPGSGVVVQGLSSGGQTASENINIDRDNLGKSVIKGAGYGIVSGLTEKLTGGNIVSKGSLDDIAKNFIGKKLSSEFGKKMASKGYELGGEMLEEFAENQIDHLLDLGIEGKTNIHSFREWLEEADETNKNTFLTTAVLSLLGLGGNTYNEIKNNPQYSNDTKQIIKSAEDTINKNDLKLNESNLQKFINKLDERKKQKPQYWLNQAQNIINQQTNQQQNQNAVETNVARENTQIPMQQNIQKQTKSNIINEKVNQYIEENKNNFKTDINLDTKVVQNQNAQMPINYKKANETTVRKRAQEIFSKLKKNGFKNNNDIIYVDNSDIKESIHHTLKDNKQKSLLNENLAVYSQIDKIIENAQQISSDYEKKGREKFSDWKYYASNVNIDNRPFIVEFDTVMKDNQRHFRIERLYEINKKIDVATDSSNNLNPRIECNIY